MAIISLLVALSILGYSTWRNEKSQDNRNHRQAAFEVLLKLNEMQPADGSHGRTSFSVVTWATVNFIQSTVVLAESTRPLLC